MQRRTLAVAAASTAVVALSIAAPIAGATAAPANTGGTCSIPLTAGSAVITRTTGHIGHGRYYTSITMTTTGNGYRLITDRAIGYGTKGAMIRRARGITGEVYSQRSWSFGSRTPNIVGHFAVVDLNTGKYGSRTC